MADRGHPRDGRQVNPGGVMLTRRGFFVTTTVTVGGALAAVACGDDPRAPMDVASDTDGIAPDVAPAVDVAPADVSTPGVDVGPSEDARSEDVQVGDVEPAVLFDPNAVAMAAEGLFPLGVQSGDPIPGGIVLQCLYGGAGPLVLVAFASGEAAEPGGELARVTAAVGDGGYVHVDLQGLAPATAGRFCFVGPEGRSPIGRFRTAASPDAVTRVAFGATSCASHTFRPFEVLSVAAADPLDFFLLLGDTVYADDANTRAEYRALWQRNLRTTEYQALLAAHPLIATWDDHEVDNNWDPETIDQTRLEAARGAFFEHLAIRRHPDAPHRIYRAFRFGKLVELFVLDCRSERRPSTRETANAEYISEAQRAWLIAALKASDATFKVIANSIPITRWPSLYPGDAQRWEGYASQRDAVIAATRDIAGVVWVAGDFHFGAVAHVDPVGGAGHGMMEVLVGPVAHVNPGLAIVEATGAPTQFLFTTAARNYGRFVAEHDGVVARLSVQHIDTAGATLSDHVLMERT